MDTHIFACPHFNAIEKLTMYSYNFLKKVVYLGYKK